MGLGRKFGEMGKEEESSFLAWVTIDIRDTEIQNIEERVEWRENLKVAFLSVSFLFNFDLYRKQIKMWIRN